MEKNRSFPSAYSSAYSRPDQFDLQEHRSNSYSFNGPSVTNDSELKRKRRVAAYNVFTVERKIQSSVRNSFKWIKNKFSSDATTLP